ncbi:hypothetical protein [Sphingomonas sp. RS2018]
MIAALLMIATAQTAAPATPPATAPAVEEKQICRRVGSTVSRIGGKRICRTKAEWDSLAPSSADDAKLRGASVPR